MLYPRVSALFLHGPLEMSESGAEFSLWDHPDPVDGLISELDVDDYGTV